MPSLANGMQELPPGYKRNWKTTPGTRLATSWKFICASSHPPSGSLRSVLLVSAPAAPRRVPGSNAKTIILKHPHFLKFCQTKHLVFSVADTK
jgi:hypothetical protein